MNLQEQIRELAQQLTPVVTGYRRHLHAHPELSFKEFETAKFVQQRLSELGIPWQTMATTGVVAQISGNAPSNKVIALRADMDALPIHEKNQVDYASKHPGVMHACGHDAHTASLLGVATILKKLQPHFGGTIKLIFQPAEEKLPGGAGMMITDGVLTNPAPTCVIGQHVSPFLPAGTIGIRRGKFMASMDELFVTIHGKGGHGAQPHRNIDPVMIAAQVLVNLQQVVSRMANPLLPTVLSFGKVDAPGGINIIPDSVYMEGTFRTLDEEWRATAHERMKQIAIGTATALGGNCDFDIQVGYPFLTNHEQLTEQVTRFATAFVGAPQVTEPEIWMAAEDFARYSQLAPSCFYLLGVGNEAKGIQSSLHTPTFNIDEEVLPLSMGLMTYIALKQLGNEG